MSIPFSLPWSLLCLKSCKGSYEFYKYYFLYINGSLLNQYGWYIHTFLRCWEVFLSLKILIEFIFQLKNSVWITDKSYGNVGSAEVDTYTIHNYSFPGGISSAVTKFIMSGVIHRRSDEAFQNHRFFILWFGFIR